MNTPKKNPNSKKKIDLVMWTKNGACSLPFVLKRIDEVMPDDLVNNKTVVDDSSTDDTGTIAESFGWHVIPNEGSGISDGANTALRHVSTGKFISFEQDLLLARDWWKRIPSLLEDPNIAVASGMRFADKPVGIRKLQQYVAEKYLGEGKLESWLKGREMAAFTLGKTLDNTIYKTEIVRSVGGYPKLHSSSGVDTILAYKINQCGYQWRVDYNVQSIHLRKGLSQELNHQYWYAKQLNEIWKEIKTKTSRKPPITKLSVITRFVMSPFTGFFMALKMNEPSISYIHALIRLFYLKGYLESGD